jgi:acetate kinase
MEGETMNDCILALNAGSSSIKCSLFATERRSDTLSLVYQGGFEGIGSEPRLLVYSPTGQSLVDRQFSTILSIDEAMSILLEWIEGHEEGVTLRGIGHRVVHGGTLFSAPVLLNAAVIDQLEQFVLLAPLLRHLPCHMR